MTILRPSYYSAKLTCMQWNFSNEVLGKVEHVTRPVRRPDMEIEFCKLSKLLAVMRNLKKITYSRYGKRLLWRPDPHHSWHGVMRLQDFINPPRKSVMKGAAAKARRGHPRLSMSSCWKRMTMSIHKPNAMRSGPFSLIHVPRLCKTLHQKTRCWWAQSRIDCTEVTYQGASTKSRITDMGFVDEPYSDIRRHARLPLGNASPVSMRLSTRISVQLDSADRSRMHAAVVIPVTLRESPKGEPLQGLAGRALVMLGNCPGEVRFERCHQPGARRCGC